MVMVLIYQCSGCGHHCGIRCTAVCYCTADDPAQAGYINVDKPHSTCELLDSSKWKLMQMSGLLDAISSRMFWWKHLAPNHI